MSDVKVGQIWQDNDKRMGKRRVRVLSVGKTHATVVSTAGYTSKVRLDRFRPNSTGYSFVMDVSPQILERFKALI